MIRLVKVAGESMAPTYRSSDLLLTRQGGRAGVRARRGDVVVFSHGGVRMIKRMVGMPDDIVEHEAGRLFVNGESVDGRPRVRGAFTQTWRVPPSSYFMAGDNAAVSDDSRVWDEPFVRVESLDTVVTRRLWGRHRPAGSLLVGQLLKPVRLRDRHRPSCADRDQPLVGEALQGPAEALRGRVEQGRHVLLGERKAHRRDAIPPGAGQAQEVVGQAALDVARGQ